MPVFWSIIAQINFISAKSCITCILFKSRGGPSCEFACLPIVEICLTIVVSVPKWVCAELGAGILVSHDLVPHKRACVNANCSSSRLNGSDQFLHILTIRIWISYIPGATWAGISFNIKPDGTSCVLKSWRGFPLYHFLEVVDQLVDLKSCIFTATREHIHISR